MAARLRFARVLPTLLLLALGAAGASAQPFRITVVDAQTGRGVPLVVLTTVHGVAYVTDSAGVIAFDEPGLMNEDVYFHVRSHGYTFPKDGLGFTGVRLRATSGGRAVVKIDRVNIAERWYRITGAGIYRDSVMLGDPVPIRQPTLNAQVLGQDSVQVARYRDRLYWFWGDTNRAAYPLGHFATSGATSELPGPGGLDPGIGIDLTYFVGPDGFSRPMCPSAGKPGMVWIDAVLTVPDADGRERLVCHYARMKSLGEMLEHGLARFEDDRRVFVPERQFPLDAVLGPRGHPVRVEEPGGVFFYFPSPFPLVRCRAHWESLCDPRAYEAYTCLQPGARWDPERPALDRDADGKLVYGWKRDTAVVLQEEQKKLIAGGWMKPAEALIGLQDADTGKPVQGHAGTVAWNAWRSSWIMIVQEAWGTSMCGEVWFAEAPELIGPWRRARKIITHDDYSFYNVAHHEFFDQDGGRVIYLEGTYTAAFSGTKTPTPRYDYNQILYRLDLADSRLPRGGKGK